MRKFLILCATAVLVLLAGNYLIYHTSYYIDWRPDEAISSFTGTSGREILVDRGNGPAPFEIRGVDLGVGKPGHFATEFAITREEYLRWFGQIQEMGANTVRIYTINSPAFYEAFLEYNQDNPDPLYLIQGLWVNDYSQNSHIDAYDPDFLDPLLEDAKRVVDVIHGRRNVSYDPNRGNGRYRYDVSKWVLGYILGVEWEDLTVAFTDHMREESAPYRGTYFYATDEATPFESMLARLGDTVAAYEAGRYKQQRLIAFANWPTTDPMSYDEETSRLFLKFAEVDVEQVKTTEAFCSGQFASYHVYPYYPDYLRHSPDLAGYLDEKGQSNTYRAYLKTLAGHHAMPVVISEFGVPSSRGMAQVDYGRGYNQGDLSERAQGEAIAACYEDIMAAGCAGSVIFTWQDEWFKRTWNTMHAVDLTQTAYWSDYQTNEQYFGLLSFDPGRERSVCYVDGDDEEWAGSAPVSAGEGLSLSVKYDEKYLYFLVRGAREDRAVYLPIDTTQKTGSAVCASPALSFDRPADFLVVLDGSGNSRVLVQERYDCLRAMYLHQVKGLDSYEFPPAADTPDFVPIRLILQVSPLFPSVEQPKMNMPTYETGKLVHGNGNPNSEDFLSLADFCYGEGFVELRLPWQLLNFSNPSDMEIHDDYYAHYGVENLRLHSLWAGVGTGEGTIELGETPLRGWGNKVTYHERLKDSYYIMQEMWATGEAAS
ncbi:hypothetical protein [Harryflintia acetispora]|uniref:hypothetical protein n=1 Tax=Harryflintia acetispora TaxID=1849041 RepID=UPI00189A1D84|nr:hypothetical protein [Harryflintia acetispora]